MFLTCSEAILSKYTIIKKEERNTAPQKEEARKSSTEVSFTYKRIKGMDKYEQVATDQNH